jgi:hypothetical protein
MHVMRTSIQDRRTIWLARILLRGAALLLLVIGAIVLWARYQGEARRAVSHLPAEERAELYRRELVSFQTIDGMQISVVLARSATAVSEPPSA